MPVGVMPSTPVTVALSVFMFPRTMEEFAGAVVTVGGGETHPVGKVTVPSSVVVKLSDQTPLTVIVEDPVVVPGST